LNGPGKIRGLNDWNYWNLWNDWNKYFLHQGSQIPRGLKKENKKKFSQERLCPLGLPTNGRPGLARSVK
jgi:hypothetical protein